MCNINYGKHNKRIVEIVKESGFSSATSTIPGINTNKTNTYKLKRYRGGIPTQGLTLLDLASGILDNELHMNYPTSICGVVYQAKWKENWKGNMMPVRHQCQFSWFCDGKSDDPEDSKTWLQCLTLARNILQGAYGDITEGATHYHSVYVNPYWADSLNETVTINEHIFYK